jgi:hypothetical protein
MKQHDADGGEAACPIQRLEALFRVLCRHFVTDSPSASSLANGTRRSESVNVDSSRVHRFVMSADMKDDEFLDRDILQ